MRLAGERPFNGSAPYQAHSPTSKSAAQSVEPRLGDLHRKVWAYIKASGGCTDEEGITATGMSPSTYRPRRIELVDAGFAEDSGKTKHTRSGRSASIWIVTDKGRVA